jgi:hypothetical protein
MALKGSCLKKLREIHGLNQGQKWGFLLKSTSLAEYAFEGFKM